MELSQLKPFAEFNANYQILEELGRGASAICYKVVNVATQQQFAMKKIEYRLIQESKAGILRQINLLKAIDHKNIIKFIEAYQDKTSIYIIMQYNKDKDLYQTIKGRKKEGKEFTYPQIWKILRQILEGLIFMHGKQIIHRDIKPSNIFINNNLEVKIGDLGAAKLVQLNEDNYTRIGTPYYLPPEIIKYDKYSFKADIWSLGVTIYYLTILELPFQASNIIRLGQVISYQQPSYPTILPPLLLNAIQDMLQKKEQNRPSAQQLYDKYCRSEPASEISEISSESTINQVIEDVKQQQWDIISDLDLPCLENHRLSSEKKGVRSHLSRRDTMHQEGNNKQYEKTTSEAGRNLTSMRDLHETKIDPIRQSEPTMPKLDDSDQTIVLTVNPNDYNNFSGYYKDPARSSMIHFNSGETNQKTKMKNSRKSSLFKHEVRNSRNTRSSLFLESKENEKAVQKSSYMSGHTRQESVIVTKKKHQELMLKLKPLKSQQECFQKQIMKQKMRKVLRPEIIVIENEAPLDI